MYRADTLSVDGSPMPMLTFAPEGNGPHPGLIVAQHLPVAHVGLEHDPFQLDVGRRYAEAGFFCAMPFLFHWWPSNADIEVKRSEFRDDRTVADLRATCDRLAAERDVDASRLGIVGHCWGGRVAWLGACHLTQLRACVVFYGGRINRPFADNAPPPIQLTGTMKASVLGLFGNDDQNPSPSDVDDYEQALRDSGVHYELHRYDGAGHGFQDYTNAERYRETQSEDAWEKAIRFLSHTLAHE